MWRRRTQTQLLFEGAAHPAGGSGALLDERVIAVASLSIVHGTAKRPPESQARGGHAGRPATRSPCGRSPRWIRSGSVVGKAASPALKRPGGGGKAPYL